MQRDTWHPTKGTSTTDRTSGAEEDSLMTMNTLIGGTRRFVLSFSKSSGYEKIGGR